MLELIKCKTGRVYNIWATDYGKVHRYNEVKLVYTLLAGKYYSNKFINKIADNNYRRNIVPVRRLVFKRESGSYIIIPCHYKWKCKEINL